MDQTRTNMATVHVLMASGRTQMLDAPWKCIGAAAYLHADAAAAGIDRFREVCLRPTNPVTDPTAESLHVSVSVLDLVDRIMDPEPNRLFVLSAVGYSALFSGSFRSLCKRSFTIREDAEAYRQTFREACTDPSVSLDYAVEKDLRISIVELELDTHPAATASPSPAP